MEKIRPSTSNVRVVRCPRCTRLLAEPTDVPLYACGGCGALLQAKHCQKESERRTISDGSNDDAEHDPHGGEGSPQHSQEQNPGIDQNVARNGKLDQLGVSSSSEQVPSSTQIQVQPQSALSSQDYNNTNDASFSNELARLTLEDLSSSMEQDEMVVEEQFEAADSCSEAASSDTITTTSSTANETKTKSGEEENREVETSSTKGAASLPAESGSQDREVVIANEALEYESETPLPNDPAVAFESNASYYMSPAGDEEAGGHVAKTSNVEQFVGTNSNAVSSPNESMLLQNSGLTWSTAVNQEVDVQNESITANREMDVEVLQNESGGAHDITSPTEVNSPKKEGELQLAAEGEEENRNEARDGNTTFVLRVKDQDTPDEYDNSRVPASSGSNSENKIEEPHKVPRTNTSAYDGSVSSYDGNSDQPTRKTVHQITLGANEAENPVSEDGRREESYRGNNHCLTPPMLNVIEMPQRTRRGPIGGAELSYLHGPSGFSTSLRDDDSYSHQHYVDSGVTSRHLHSSYKDGRMFPEAAWAREDLPMHTYYESYEEIHPHPRFLRYKVRDLYVQTFDTRTVSPHVFSEPECYSWGYDTASEDQRQRDDQETSRFHSRRKSQPRWICPMAGAAPFVTCYQCLQLLELPLEFLVLRTRRRRSYRVKCSTCLSNLEFAVLVDKGRRRQLVPLHGETGEHAQDKGKSVMVENQRRQEAKRSGSLLHRLMGYATPSAMLDGYES